jgi:hypothetical protein
VNLWPIAYYRTPALSVLWPIGEFADDRFAIRPLFSMYRDGEDDPWSEFNSLGGLFSIDTERHRQLFFPLFYHDGEDDTFISLLYAQGPGWTALPPLLTWCDYGPKPGYTRLFLFGGLAGFDRSADWIFPLYYHEHTDYYEHDDFHEYHVFLSLLYAQGRDWTAIPPLLSWWNRDSASGDTSLYLLGGLAGFKPDADWIFPLYLRDKKDDRFLSLLYAQGRDWTAIPPLLSWWDATSGGRALLGLGGWDDTRAWVFPFFYRDAASDTLVTPLWASQSGLWSAIPPLLSWRSRNPATGASSLFLLGGFVGFSPDANWAVPLYYRDKKSGFFLSPLYAEGRDRAAIPPLLSWWDDESGRVLLGLGGWEPDESWAIPFWYEDSKRFLTPLWGRFRTGQDCSTYWFTPLFGTRSGARTGSWLFPLWDVERSGNGSWDNLFLLLGGSRGGPRYDGRSSVWFFPLFSDDSDPKADALRAEMDAPRASDRNYYHKWPATLWDRKTRTSVTNLVVSPVRDGASEESTFLLGLCGSEHHVTLNPPPWQIARSFGGSSAKGPLARFADPGAATHRPPSSPDSSLPTNAVARYASEDSSWFFPLWSQSRTRGVMFDLPSGEKALDAEQETFRALLFLYDWRHESVPEESHDYTRRRVLWRLYHYERLNGDESTDIFPAITYDRRKDGYSKFSFLWRFFRYERDPGKGTSLDILFLPLRRPAQRD